MGSIQFQSLQQSELIMNPASYSFLSDVNMNWLEEKLVGCSLDVIEPPNVHVTGIGKEVRYADIHDPFAKVNKVDVIAEKLAHGISGFRSLATTSGVEVHNATSAM